MIIGRSSGQKPRKGERRELLSCGRSKTVGQRKTGGKWLETEQFNSRLDGLRSVTSVKIDPRQGSPTYAYRHPALECRAEARLIFHAAGADGRLAFSRVVILGVIAAGVTNAMYYISDSNSS